LAYKESDRLAKTIELLHQGGFVASPKNDGLHIVGHGFRNLKPKNFRFDTDLDHRMAMAAGLMRLRGFGIDIWNSQVVSKSFPEFWGILEGEA
jgi:3-phosphoshikimate 1-carboxyvinyltransferase